MTVERGLEPGWLNNGAAGYIGINPPVIRYKNIRGLDIDIVSPDFLLAMKIRSSRPNHEDITDTEFLLRLLKISSKEKAIDVFSRYFPDKAISDEAEDSLKRAFTIIECGNPLRFQDEVQEKTELQKASEIIHDKHDDPQPHWPRTRNGRFRP
jgi:hypothetical protein